MVTTHPGPQGGLATTIMILLHHYGILHLFEDEFQLFKCQKVALSGLEVEKYKMLTASQE